MKKEQEPKYRINLTTQCIINRVSLEPIPDDEPIMIFRARDKNAALMIAYYKKLCLDPHHKQVVNERLHDFVNFAHDYPERMKEPDTDTDTDTDKCEHGRGLTDYCEPCGRINGGG